MLIFLILVIITIIYFLIFNKKENWCNTYSGWPGPIEMGFSADQLIYGQGPRHTGYKYKSAKPQKHKTRYLSFKNFPGY